MDFSNRRGIWLFLSVLSSFVIFCILHLPRGEAINIVSPFAFNVYVVPIKLPIQIGSSLSSLVALGALVVAKLALIGTAFLKGPHSEEEYSIPLHIPQPHPPIGLPPHGPWSRRRRDTSVERESNSITEASQHRILTALYKKDTHGCLTKFLCELGTIADRSRLRLEEQLILTLFRHVSGSSKSAAATTFSKALRIGENNKNPKVCTKYFPRCRFDSSQMMSFYYKLRPSISL